MSFIDSGFTAEETEELARHGVNEQVDQGGQDAAQEPEPDLEPAAQEGASTEQTRDPATGRFQPAGQAPAQAAQGAAAQGAAQSQAQPEGAGEGGAQSTVQAPPPGYVPIAALHEARMKMAGTARQMQTLMQRTNQILEQRRNEPVLPPEFRENPEAWAQHMEQFVLGQHEQSVASQETQQISEMLTLDEQAFKMQAPDMDAAHMFYASQRNAELTALGLPPQQRMKTMTEEVVNLSREAFASGQSPSEIIYNLSIARGYRPGQQAQPAPVPPGYQPPPGYRLVADNAPAPQPGTGAVDRVRAVAAGQGVSRSLSGGQGTGGADIINAEALLSMTDEEFANKLGLGQPGADERFKRFAGS